MTSTAIVRAGRQSANWSARRISEDVWQEYDPEITQLYLRDRKNLSEVMDYFSQHYGFKAT
jgi:hypothetical protein